MIGKMVQINNGGWQILKVMDKVQIPVASGNNEYVPSDQYLVRAKNGDSFMIYPYQIVHIHDPKILVKGELYALRQGDGEKPLTMKFIRTSDDDQGKFWKFRIDEDNTITLREYDLIDLMTNVQKAQISNF